MACSFVLEPLASRPNPESAARVRASGDYIYLEITFEARAAWSGYLSFEGRADHRARRRSRIAILEDALSGSY